MTASMLRPQLQASLLRKLNTSSSRKKNLLQKGFTLVELMIVIVIVGILSAVALPNFLSQTSKAKATECTTKAGSILSQVGAEHLTSSTAAAALLASEITTANDNSDLCTFSNASLTAPEYGVNVVGAGDLASKFALKSCVNGDTGKRGIATGTALASITAPTC